MESSTSLSPFHSLSCGKEAFHSICSTTDHDDEDDRPLFVWGKKWSGEKEVTLISRGKNGPGAEGVFTLVDEYCEACLVMSYIELSR